MLSHKKILYADQSDFYRKNLGNVFQRNGFLIDLAKGGFQALALIEEKKYDLVILDDLTEDMSGHEVLMLIRHQFTQEALPVIMFTSESEDEIRELCQAYGANGFVRKENQFAKLLDTVKKLLGYEPEKAVIYR